MASSGKRCQFRPLPMRGVSCLRCDADHAPAAAPGQPHKPPMRDYTHTLCPAIRLNVGAGITLSVEPNIPLAMIRSKSLWRDRR